MSGHSKWHNIKHEKGVADAKRGQVFTRHAKLIAIISKNGGADPEMNPSLRSAIVNAKSDGVPSANIEKAIKKGAGLDKEKMNLDEFMYEGFGPNRVAIYVQVITDNRNRSASNIKSIFGKNGGNMGEAGTIAWMFDRKGVILAKAPHKDTDTAELEAIDAGAEDISKNEDEFEILTSPVDLMKVRENLSKVGFEITRAELSFLPKNFVKVDDQEIAQKVFKLIDALEEDEDVADVYHNMD